MSPHTHSYTNALTNTSCGNQCADQSQMEVWLLLTGSSIGKKFRGSAFGSCHSHTYILATFTTQFNFSKVWLEGAFYSKLFSPYFSNFSLWGGIKATKRSTLVRNVMQTSLLWLDVVHLKANTVIYHIWMKYWILNCCFMTDMFQQHAFWQLTHDWNSAISTVLANKLLIMEIK